MATFYIREYEKQGKDAQGQLVNAGQEPALADQTAPVGSVQSLTLGSKTAFVRVHTDAICSYAVGANPTATTANARMAANGTEYFAVVPGSGMKVSVISNT